LHDVLISAPGRQLTYEFSDQSGFRFTETSGRQIPAYTESVKITKLKSKKGLMKRENYGSLIVASVVWLGVIWAPPTAAQSWYTADVHLHAQCAGFKWSAPELLAAMKNAGINVGSVLVWGGDQSQEQDSVNLLGQRDDPVSESEYILRWGVEISELPGVWNGHMYFLNVAQQDVIEPNELNYPGQDYFLPNYDYIQSEGGIIGYAHPQGWPIGRYLPPLPDWLGHPRELPLDVALARVDFISAEMMTDELYFLWYGMLNAGFHLPILGDSDIGCYWPTVGRYHAAFTLPEGTELTYENFVDAVRKGRTVIKRHAFPPDFLDIRVNEVGLGGELILPNKPTTVNVEVDASSVSSDQRVELMLNGKVIESQALTESVQTFKWTVPIEKSSWLAAKTTGPHQYSPAPGYSQPPNGDGAHTSATFVLLGGCPVRLDPAAARNWKGYLDAYYARGVDLGEFGASEKEVGQKVEEAKRVWERIAQEGEGSAEMDCKGFSINSGLNDAWFNPDTSGQGFFITVFPDIQQIFLTWFTFDTERPPEDVEAHLGEPGHRWLTAQGPFDGDTASLTIYTTEGGVFDAADPPAQNDGIGDGTLTIEFADCSQGLVTYEMIAPNVSGEIPIQRIANDNIALCESLAGQ
jgi:hypothetical protein